ncbi:MAG TPA: hypothetical protein VK524_26040, partial [Polyangiaceae bacterium]|nr:hypothetical protein [Polyangiaceae bacterium]
MTATGQGRALFANAARERSTARRVVTKTESHADTWQPSAAQRRSGILTSSRATVLALTASVLGISVIFSSAVLVLIHGNSHFVGDDLIALAMTHSMSFHEFVIEPINEHFVPLHRAITYVANLLAPGNFAIALLVLYAFQAVSMLYVYRTLLLLESRMHMAPWVANRSGERLRPLEEPVYWLLFGLFCVNVYLGPLYMWWTAGLHRLPFIAFSCIAVYYYLRFRFSGGGGSAVLCSAGVVLALGFYSKAMLLPWYLVGLEICLWSDTPPRRRSRNWALLGALALGVVIYACVWAAVWTAMQPASARELNTDVRFQLQFLAMT